MNCNKRAIGGGFILLMDSRADIRILGENVRDEEECELREFSHQLREWDHSGIHGVI